jgi:hypothetical protein
MFFDATFKVVTTHGRPMDELYNLFKVAKGPTAS